MFERYVRGCCINCHSLFFLICRTFEVSIQSEHLYLLFGIWANLSKMFFIKLPASDEKERNQIYDILTFTFYSRKSCQNNGGKYLHVFIECIMHSIPTFKVLQLQGAFHPVSCMRMLRLIWTASHVILFSSDIPVCIAHLYTPVRVGEVFSRK